jgi:hypothetical protein
MSETKFTKGEWKLARGRFDSYLIERKNESGTIDHIATVHDQNRVDREDEVKANAALMLAAPSMYMALSEAYEFLGPPEKNPQDDSGLFELSALVREVLAKARGEP